MKKRNFLAALLLLCAGLQTAWAQKVALYLSNNQIVEYSLEHVDSIKFVEEELHAYVDLGLPSGTLWATCNVGAESPEEYGYYFAWGGVRPKTEFSWSTYEHGISGDLSKYCTDSYYGKVDNKTELEAVDDAATVNWGNGWQTPSSEQFEELLSNTNTTTTWTTLNDVKGRMIISRKNGNSIFLPAAGWRNNTKFYGSGTDGRYWSRSLISSYSTYGRSQNFYSSNIYMTDDARYEGHSVRPVRVKK